MLKRISFEDAMWIARRILAGEPPPGYEELYAAYLELRVIFDKPTSWYLRALARAIMGVRQVGRRHWLVPGIPGDHYSMYNVWLSRGGRYVCDCYGRAYGNRRSRMICTHVAAVQLTRRRDELERVLRKGHDSTRNG